MSKRKPNVYKYYEKLKNMKKKSRTKKDALKIKRQKKVASDEYRKAYKQWLAEGDYSKPKPILEKF